MPLAMRFSGLQQSIHNLYANCYEDVLQRERKAKFLTCLQNGVLFDLLSRPLLHYENVDLQFG